MLALLTVFVHNERLQCARCLNSFRIKDSGARFFLQSECSSIGTSCDRPVPLPYDTLHIGNKVTHHSHKLYVFRDVTFCPKCGMRGPSRLVKLGKPCAEPTAYGKLTKAALLEGKLPPLLDKWPDTLSPHAEGRGQDVDNFAPLYPNEYFGR